LFILREPLVKQAGLALMVKVLAAHVGREVMLQMNLQLIVYLAHLVIIKILGDNERVYLVKEALILEMLDLLNVVVVLLEHK
jgi:hypothetical protein